MKFFVYLAVLMKGFTSESEPQDVSHLQHHRRFGIAVTIAEPALLSIWNTLDGS
jgi:hypothetical protein